MKNSELIKYAIDAMSNSYAPYSKFNVGAALLCKNENVYTGCNIENASFAATLCAERTAICKAISSGDRDFEKIAIVAKDSDGAFKKAAPCGICRQVMSEFCKSNFKIIIAKSEYNFEEYTLTQLLPNNFNLD